MTSMIEVKTAELSGPALRYAVMIAIGGELRAEHAPLEGKDYQRVGLPAGLDDHGLWFEAAHPAWAGTAGCRTWRPDEDWAQAGPLIEKYQIELMHFGSYGRDGCPWEAQLSPGDHHYIDQRPGEASSGATPMIALCRAIVADKLGDTVQVPAALVGGGA